MTGAPLGDGRRARRSRLRRAIRRASASRSTRISGSPIRARAETAGQPDPAPPVSTIRAASPRPGQLDMGLLFICFQADLRERLRRRAEPPERRAARGIHQAGRRRLFLRAARRARDRASISANRCSKRPSRRAIHVHSTAKKIELRKANMKSMRIALLAGRVRLLPRRCAAPARRRWTSSRRSPTTRSIVAKGVDRLVAHDRSVHRGGEGGRSRRRRRRSTRRRASTTRRSSRSPNCSATSTAASIRAPTITRRRRPIRRLHRLPPHRIRPVREEEHRRPRRRSPTS